MPSALLRLIFSDPAGRSDQSQGGIRPHRLLRASLERRSGAGRTPFDAVDRGAVPLDCRKRGVTGRRNETGGLPHSPTLAPCITHQASRKGLSVRTRSAGRKSLAQAGILEGKTPEKHGAGILVRQLRPLPPVRRYVSNLHDRPTTWLQTSTERENVEPASIFNLETINCASCPA